jgi:hypothetical protein
MTDLHDSNRRDLAGDKTQEEKLSGPRPCPRQRFTVQDLRAYLTLRDSGDEVPGEVTEHLARCAGCASTWEFLARTNPLLAAHRKQRFGLVAQQLLNAPALPVDAVAEIAVVSQERLANTLAPPVQFDTTTERQQWVDELTSALAPTGQSADELDQLTDVSTPLDANAIVERCDAVRSVSDATLRAKTAMRLGVNLKRQVPSEPPDELLKVADVLMDESKPVVTLNELVKGEALATAVAFIASIPFTNLSPDEPVLEREAGSDAILVHPPRLQQAMDTYKDLVRAQSAGAGIP